MVHDPAEHEKIIITICQDSYPRYPAITAFSYFIMLYHCQTMKTSNKM